MATGTKIIKRRLKSIKNTRKITKAMELVAASKMKRAVDKVLATRPYSNLAWDTVLRLVKKVNTKSHPLLTSRKEIKKIGIILISSNRGLCGGFNSQAAGRVLKSIGSLKSIYPTAEISLITLGRKGGEALIHAGISIVADFKKEDIVSEVEEVLPVAKIIMNDYLTGKYDRVFIVYTDFVSSLKQVPRVKQILPLEKIPDEMLGGVKNQPADLEMTEEHEYIFEPSPDKVLADILPRLVEIQLFQALLESNASEHSARMLAMRNASDAASDMIYDLTLSFNKARQASITQEISEISAGKAVLE